MNSTTATGAKSYPERGVTTKVTAMASNGQQSPNRPSSTAPNLSIENDRTKSPLRSGNEDAAEGAHGSAHDAFRGIPPQASAGLGYSIEPLQPMNPNARTLPSANGPNQGYLPHPFYAPGMNVASQQGFGPTPQMPFFATNFNPAVYTPATTSNRPGSALPRVPSMDPKFPPNQLGHAVGSQQMANNMARRQSSYFQVPPMSPVQTSYGPRGWMPNNPGQFPGQMTMANGNGPMQNPAMYPQPMMGGNPPMMTPPAAVQGSFGPPAFGPQPVTSSPYGYPPTPPEPAVPIPNDIPPPIPSVYPDPAYSNINNCIYNPKGTTNVYIRGLRPETSDEDLYNMVRQYGTLISTKAIIDTQTKLCKGQVLFFLSTNQ